MARTSWSLRTGGFAAAAAKLIALSASFASASQDHEIVIENFDDPVHVWTTMNDPVMGGKSSSAIAIEDGIAKFDGEVAIVPFLNAPGFIQMLTRGGGSGPYPDLSACTSLKMNLTATEEYSGYRVSFGNVHLPEGRHAYGYKADFDAPVGEYGDVVIPFTDFSSKWDEATGDQIVSCDDDAKYCPDVNTLKDMKTFAIWGEGVEGDLHLRVKSISAVGCSSGEGPPSPFHLGVDMLGATREGAGEGIANASKGNETRAKGKGLLGSPFMLLGGIVAFAAFLSFVIEKRSRRNSYAEVLGAAFASETV